MPASGQRGGRLDAARRELARAVPDLIRAALADYRRLAAAGAEDVADAKAVAARHAACKAAVAHIESLIRLARWAQDEAADQTAPDLDALVAEARAGLAARDPGT